MFSTDIAVGAPYDGNGKVFIYHGSANGVNTKPTQVTRQPGFLPLWWGRGAVVSAFCLIINYLGLSKFSTIMFYFTNLQ